MRTTLAPRQIGVLAPAMVWSSALLVVLAGAGVANATTFAVNSTVDAGDSAAGDGLCESVSGTGVCTLRAAIEEANALAGADAVNVPGGNYALVSDALVVNDELTITGTGAGATIIDGGGIALGGIAASIRGVTVRNAHQSGGGIINYGTLTLTDSIVSDNGVGGIDNEGTLTVERVTVRGNSGGLAGGIASSGSLVVVDSTIANNSGQIGGGVLALWGTATISNSTVSGNSAVHGGGISAGLCAFGCTSAYVVLNNVTITNNTASTGDGGGVAVFGGADGSSTLRLGNSVIAGNSDQGGDYPDCGPGLLSDGYNLIGNTAGCFIYGDLTGNVTGVSAGLGPLQNNGGPTPTHAPLAGSRLVDAGNPAAPGSESPACEASDQRGVVRPQGARCDIGAVETGAPAPTTTTVTTTSSSTSTTVPLPFCSESPRNDCMGSLSEKGSLLLRHASTDTKDIVSWKWRSSAVVAKTDFGSPTATTDYALCAYDASGAGQTLRLAATVPAGGVCAGRSCWNETSSGFHYADRGLTRDGLATIRLKAAAGTGRIAIKGRGANLPLPSLPLTTPVTVQLQRRDGVACWAGTFSVPGTNTSEAFKARVD